MDTARDCMIVITAGSNQEDIEGTNINLSSWNPFTPKNLLMILLTVSKISDKKWQNDLLNFYHQCIKYVQADFDKIY